MSRFSYPSTEETIREEIDRLDIELAALRIERDALKNEALKACPWSTASLWPCDLETRSTPTAMVRCEMHTGWIRRSTWNTRSLDAKLDREQLLEASGLLHDSDLPQNCIACCTIDALLAYLKEETA